MSSGLFAAFADCGQSQRNWSRPGAYGVAKERRRCEVTKNKRFYFFHVCLPTRVFPRITNFPEFAALQQTTCQAHSHLANYSLYLPNTKGKFTCIRAAQKTRGCVPVEALRKDFRRRNWPRRVGTGAARSGPFTRREGGRSRVASGGRPRLAARGAAPSKGGSMQTTLRVLGLLSAVAVTAHRPAAAAEPRACCAAR